MNWQNIISFWFEELTPKQHFVKDLQLDSLIKERFGQVLHQAKIGELYHWRTEAKGRLAEIIVLDQFSRNIYRDTPEAFASDPLALVLAQEAINLGVDGKLTANEKSFLYMPYMHSESQLIHEQAVQLFNQPGLENNYEFELKHKVIIDKFGRYPHRNVILGRASSAEELEFLATPGSSF